MKTPTTAASVPGDPDHAAVIRALVRAYAYTPEFAEKYFDRLFVARTLEAQPSGMANSVVWINPSDLALLMVPEGSPQPCKGYADVFYRRTGQATTPLYTAAPIAQQGGAEAAATVVGYDSWHRIAVDWHRLDMEPGTKLYTHPAPPPSASEFVTVPREIVANYARSTAIPRHRRICEEALAAQPAPGVGGCSLYRSASYDTQDGGYPVHRGNEAPIARFIMQDDAVDYAAYRNRLIDKNGSDSLEATRPAESVAQGGEVVLPAGWYTFVYDCTQKRGQMVNGNMLRDRAHSLLCALKEAATPTPGTGSGGEA